MGENHPANQGRGDLPPAFRRPPPSPCSPPSLSASRSLGRSSSLRSQASPSSPPPPASPPLSPTSGRTLRVAALQLSSTHQDVVQNLHHALPFMRESAALGAKLILLPELYPTQGLGGAKVWEGGEFLHSGPTREIVSDTAKLLEAYIGISFAEIRGDHFYNTFVLTDPRGEIAGVVRKENPSSVESFFFNGASHSDQTNNYGHVIDTPIGRIGVGLSNENSLGCMAEHMLRGNAEILLMPHSTALPLPSFLISKKSCEQFCETLTSYPRAYARTLSIPVVMCNMAGKCQRGNADNGGSPTSIFAGQSQIVDAKGSVLASLDTQEDRIIVADVVLPSRPLREVDEAQVQWLCGQYWSPLVCWPADIRLHLSSLQVIGKFMYRCSLQRRKKAQRMQPPALLLPAPDNFSPDNPYGNVRTAARPQPVNGGVAIGLPIGLCIAASIIIAWRGIHLIKSR